MTAAQRKIFRIERNRAGFLDDAAAAEAGNGPANGHAGRDEEIIALLHDIRDRMQPREAPLSAKIIEDYKHDIHEARKIKEELNRVYKAITDTKQEIATLRISGARGVELSRMTDELDAIVDGTEKATEAILHAAEEIDGKAIDLIAALKQQANKDDASDIQEQVVKIFEACNFQDLTGQRVTKVVTAFRFIGERVDRMMEIWGGIESFKDVEPAAVPGPEEDAGLLNGPALESDEDVASQDDIDALFN